ncbi:MAG: ATP-binding protein, partial [Proteobacteria bacterium]|nr:ATP-binding protein [Pseudomonadota bacterium]
VQALVAALGFLGAGLVAAVIVQVRYGLRPLRHLQAALGRVRSGDADRLEGEYPREIAPVVGELNALIDHNAEVVARARTHVGNLAHALKTPISVLMNDSDADDTPLAGVVKHQVEVMRRYVDHYLVRARTAASGTVIGSRTLVLPALQSLKRTLDRIHADRRLSITISGGERLNFRGERQDFDEVLGNLMDNACKWATSKVHVSVEKQQAVLVFSVEDDGPGISDEQQQTALGRGKRLDEAVSGSGLGLSIVKDIAGLYGGGVFLGRSSLGGLKVELTLPAAANAGGF